MWGGRFGAVKCSASRQNGTKCTSLLSFSLRPDSPYPLHRIYPHLFRLIGIPAKAEITHPQAHGHRDDRTRSRFGIYILRQFSLRLHPGKAVAEEDPVVVKEVGKFLTEPRVLREPGLLLVEDGRIALLLIEEQIGEVQDRCVAIISILKYLF